MNPETEQIFEKLALERGLVTRGQMAEVRRLQAEAGTPGRPRTPLLDLLLEKGYGDRGKLRELVQLAMIRSGVERVTIGGFELLEKIGQGGMGAVYRASQVNVGRPVALKLMRPKLAKDRRHLERFLREARASAKLSHPNVVQGIDAGDDKGYYYFAMEFVDGETLRRITQRDGALPEKQCVDIGIQMARALEHADKFGMIHRDVKPENILIEHDTGVAKLADLGLVKSTTASDTSVTQVGVAIGTPNYISPEQARGEQEIDIRSDIYSLGATLYHVVTGTLPFAGDSPPVIMSKHMSEGLDAPQTRNPEVSAGFSCVIQKMMAKDRDERYQTPSELLGDLERVAGGEQPLATVPKGPSVRAAGAPARRSRAAAIAVGALLFVLLLVASLSYLLRPAERESGNEAEAGILYGKAAELVVAQPMNFADIIGDLKRSLELDPKGPNAATARALKRTAENFRVLTGVPVTSPDDWVATAQRLKDLAAKAPKDPPYAKGIHDYLRGASRKHISNAISRAVRNPLETPDSAAWLDAVVKAAPDRAVAEEARARRTDLGKILQENADYILDAYGKRADAAAQKQQFKEAIRILRSSVPEDLRTPQLRDLIEKKIEHATMLAARRADRLKAEVWDALDGGRLDTAGSHARWAKGRLGLPELKPQIDELCRTVEAAPKFLPLLDELRKLEASAPEKGTAVGQLALKIEKSYGKDPYVAQKLAKYQAAIRDFLARDPIAEQIEAAEKLIAEKKYAEADAAITALLREAGLKEEQRLEAMGLRVRLGPEYALVKLLAAALAPKLPVTNVYLKLKGGQPVRGDIISVSMESLEVRARAGGAPIPWSRLGPNGLHDLAFGELALVKEDDPYALYHMGALFVGTDDAKGKSLLTTAISLAEKRTDAELPGRALLLAGAQSLLGQIRESEAEGAMKQVKELVRSAAVGRGLAKAVAAYHLFKTDYGETQYVAANADELWKVSSALASAIVRDRAAPVTQLIRKSDWRSIVARLEDAVREAEKIAPIPDERRKIMDALIAFGKNYVAEETIYRAVFSVRPWRGARLGELKTDKNALVAGRADRYSEFFEVRVGRSGTAKAQRDYASREWDGKKKDHVPVKDVNVRIARLNAVFAYWPRARGECAWAEVQAAQNVRGIKPTGNVMAIVMLENFLRYRSGAPQAARAEAEYTRLNAYIQLADRVPLLGSHVSYEAKQAVSDYRSVAEYPARFCLMAAEQSEAAGDDENAYKLYGRLCSSSKFKDYVWLGYLGRGRIRERMKKYTAALSDYDAAFVRSQGWGDGYRCAEAIANLCVHSGKLNKPGHAKRVVAELLKRVGKGKGARQRWASAMQLLAKREK